MEKHKINLTLDLNLNKLQSVTLKQYNNDSQWLVISVTENGMPIVFSETDTCMFKMQTPDGRKIYNDAIIAGNTVIVEITANCCAYPGTGEAELNIIDENSAQIATMNFYLTIVKSVYENEEIEGSDEFVALVTRIVEADTIIAESNTMIAEGNAIISKTNEIIENTTEAASSAANSASIASKKATDAEAYARDSFSNATIASTKAEESKENAESANESKISAENSANTAKAKASEASESARMARSYTHGDTGIREGEKSDNAKYYHVQSKNNSETAKLYLTKVEQAGTEAVEKINNALNMDMPFFQVDLTSGHLVYQGGRFLFHVNDAGNLEWRLEI